MSNVIVSKEFMMNFLAIKDSETVMHFVGRALVALFNRQIEAEKASNDTKASNDRGFSKPDAPKGSITAKYYLKHKKLQQWQVDSWVKEEFRGRPRIVKYSEQLNEIALEKKRGDGANAYRAAKMKG